MTKRKPAFTLLELLTVISILGLLMAILLPSLSAARQSAKANACLSNLKGIGTALALYLNENEDKLPPVRLERPLPSSDQFYVNDLGRLAPRWQWFLPTDQGPVINPAPFGNVIKSRGYFYDADVARPSGESGQTMSNKLFTCPSLEDDQFAFDVRDGAYGYNYQYLGNTRRETDPDRWDNFVVGMHRIRKPAATVSLADSRGAGQPHGPHSYTLDPPRMAVEHDAMSFGPNGPSEVDEPGRDDVPPGFDKQLYAYSPVEARHKRSGNVIFLDSHGEAKTLRELGYQLGDGSSSNPLGMEAKRDVPIPIRDPNSGVYTATNRLWNGDDADPLAHEHAPAP